ncbi:MAG: 7,8-didemethyl-8-hydroxy-5-deazariboflavin synthase subunit CofG, partial [Actinomycetota bacterium]|nr:7,8-didemethyl-8-hydroxy-5-deazariboflavin synthase subunit CofG [Actinomycetota bacterium]
MRRRVSFSRNVTLSLSRTCQCHCKYCAFATHRAHLQTPAEVRALLDGAARRRVKELLVLTGEAPDHNAGVARQLTAWGFEGWIDYVRWACREGLDRGLLAHTNLGVLDRSELAALREVTASQGLMLESVRDDLVAHQGSPTKAPAVRLETIRAAGELRIPFTSGILVGIGESEDDRVAALEALAEVHAEHGHLQEVILQNFVPHRRYYGEEPAEIATGAAEQYWRTGLSDAPHSDLPSWAGAVSIEDMEALVGHARRLLPGVGIQVPPNLVGWWPRLVAAGATDLGGLSANGDHISPEHPFPSPAHVRKRLARDGVALSERLCVYGRYLDPEWLDQSVLDVVRTRYWSFIPRGGSGRGDPPFAIRPDGVAASVSRARDGAPLTPEELTALFAETRPEAIEDMRQAADELRADLAGDTVTYVVNRNVNVSNVCIVGCAFCGFGQGRRSPDAYEHDRDDFVRRLDEAVAYGATELCMQSGIHPDWTLDDYLGWLRLARDAAPS